MDSVRDLSGGEMKGFTIQRLGGLRNKWITDILSEILSTFLLALFVYASGAQSLVTYGEASNPTGRALAGCCGLLVAIYAGMKAAGGCANPNVSIMFCLTGKIPWKKLPSYIFGEMIGAFLAAALTYGIYRDMLTNFDGGVRSVYGDTASAHLFTSLPNGTIISKATGFFDVVVGTSLLTGCITAIIDPPNSNPDPGIVPIAMAFMLFGIVMTFGVNTGAAINIALDFSGRLFASLVYGSEVFSHWDYWFWVPLLGGVCGAVLGPFVYQLMVGNHLNIVKDEEFVREEYVGEEKNGIDSKVFTLSSESIKTDNTEFMSVGL